MTQSPPLDPRLGEAIFGFQDHLGFELSQWREGFAVIEMPLAPFLMNRQGIPHGGVHATLLDTAMGFAGCYTGDADNRRMALTLSLTVNYLAKINGTRLIATAQVTGGGLKTYFAEARIEDELGTLMATATGVFRYVGTTSAG
ncbi:PaaI family thioesterase [Rhodobacteraceae bacterium KMM 6894]|nr:PaaI family thioesterase [Rhodobacteraceae bacterium KMM 6894]